MTGYHSIVVFDGVCVLCNGWVDFILRRDPQGRYQFAAMQTPGGRRLLVEHGIDPDEPLSFLLVDDGRGYTDSDAIIRLLRGLGRGWNVLATLGSLVPRFMRDPLYRWVARRRYRVFGRRAQCRLPTADIADRFLP